MSRSAPSTGRPLSLVLLCSALFALLPQLAHAQSSLNPILPANPPQCGRVTVSWSSTGDASQFYTARIVDPASETSPHADDSYTFVAHGNGTLSAEWNVGLIAGTRVALAVTDDSGNRAYSEATTVAAGDDSCLASGVTGNSSGQGKYDENGVPRSAATSGSRASMSVVSLATAFAIYRLLAA